MEVDSAFDAGRSIWDKAVYSGCYAPTTSMYFDQFGKVRACCQNTTSVMGDITRQSIHDIWESAATGALRAALEVRDLSHGCDHCSWHVAEGNPEAMYSRVFDALPVRSARPRHPVRMDFALTNSCNLQCVMCNGDWSSAIRARREGRPPLPVVYGDAFFEELTSFLPHLELANFLGGEPLLGAEPIRVMESIADVHPDLPVTITTNGTQWSPRVERLCRGLRVSFCVSLDGVTRTTYESVRVGADFGVVMSNLERMRAVAAEQDGAVSVAHCLMRSNWHEFLELLVFAEERELDVVVNTVTHPAAHSLYTLDAARLGPIVEHLERRSGEAATRLVRLEPVWAQQVLSLKRHLEVLDGGAAVVPSSTGPWEQDLREAAQIDDDPELLEMLTEWGDGAPLTICWDGDRIVREVDPAIEVLLGSTSEILGHPVASFAAQFHRRYGEPRHSPVPGWDNTFDVDWVPNEEEGGIAIRFSAGRMRGMEGMVFAVRPLTRR